MFKDGFIPNTVPKAPGQNDGRTVLYKDTDVDCASPNTTNACTTIIKVRSNLISSKVYLARGLNEEVVAFGLRTIEV